MSPTAEGALPHVPASVWEQASAPPKPRLLSFSVSALHNGFFVLAKIKRNAKTVTDHLGRLYECSVKTAGFPNILYSIGRYFALWIFLFALTVTWGNYSAPWETLWHGSLVLKSSYKAVEKFALVVQVGLAVNSCEKNSLIRIFKPKWLICLTEVQHTSSHDQLKRFWQTSNFP